MVRFLGHVIRLGTLQVDEVSTKAFRELEHPKTATMRPVAKRLDSYIPQTTTHRRADRHARKRRKTRAHERALATDNQDLKTDLGTRECSTKASMKATRHAWN